MFDHDVYDGVEYMRIVCHFTRAGPLGPRPAAIYLPQLSDATNPILAENNTDVLTTANILEREVTVRRGSDLEYIGRRDR